MRAVKFVALLCLAVPQLHAQEQEQKLMDRVLRPNMEQQNRAQQKAFTTNKVFGTGRARVGEFYFNQRVRTKSAATGRFKSRSFWQGDFKISTQEAKTQERFVIPNASARVRTETHEVEQAHGTEKATPVKAYATEKFKGRGTRQGGLDHENAPRDPMTIDEVRELLNKAR